MPHHRPALFQPLSALPSSALCVHLQCAFGGDASTEHKISGLGIQSRGPLSFKGGRAVFEGPLEMDGDSASLDLEYGAAMSLAGGVRHKIGGKGLGVKGDMQFGSGIIDCSAPVTMDVNATCNITDESTVLSETRGRAPSGGLARGMGSGVLCWRLGPHHLHPRPARLQRTQSSHRCARAQRGEGFGNAARLRRPCA